MQHKIEPNVFFFPIQQYARKVEKKYVQFITIWHLLKQGYSMIDFEAFKVRVSSF
jgi:hypothetical protein